MHLEKNNSYTLTLFRAQYDEALHTDPLTTVEGMIKELESMEEKRHHFIWLMKGLATHKEQWKAIYKALKKQKLAAFQVLSTHAPFISDAITIGLNTSRTPDALTEEEVDEFIERIGPFLETIQTRFKLEGILDRE